MLHILAAVFLSFLLGFLIKCSCDFKINAGKYDEDNGMIVTIPSVILSGGIVACLMWYFFH